MRCVKTKHQNELAAKRGPGMRRAQNSKGSKNERDWGKEEQRVCILNTAPTSKSSASPWAANKRIK